MVRTIAGATLIVTEAIRTSLEEVRAHKLRSLLTALGVILGTFALVVVLSVMEGVKQSVWAGFEDLGMDGVLIVSGKTPSNRLDRAKAHLSRGMRIEDETVIREGSLLRAVAPVGESRTVVSAGQAVRRVTAFGITHDFAIAKGRKVSAGRFIAQRDQNARATVAVLGFKLKEKLYGGEEAIGQQVTVSGRRLTVVGVGTKFNDTFVNDSSMRKETEGLYMPLSTYESIFGRANSVSYFILKTTDPKKAVEAEGQVASLYSRAHHGIRDVSIENVGKEISEERGKVEKELGNWMIVFFAIAGVSILIGGVGIFSVLKISISERLYEIGLRKSLGAGNGEIFFQFLVESITISTIGAAVGAILGSVCVGFIASNFPAGLSVSPFALVVSMSFAIAIGLFAGLYPSISAARLEPVEALRS